MTRGEHGNVILRAGIEVHTGSHGMVAFAPEMGPDFSGPPSTWPDGVTIDFGDDDQWCVLTSPGWTEKDDLGAEWRAYNDVEDGLCLFVFVHVRKDGG